MALPPQILDFVDRFERGRDAYRSGGYKEAEIRSEFIDPFFEALGWDVHNKQECADRAREEGVAKLVGRMLSLHKKLAAKTAHEKTVLQREIETTDRQIDELVYELYGLTDEEIKIVEEATS